MVSFKRDVLGKKYLSIILFTLFLSFLSVFISSSLLSHTSSAESIESDLEITVSDVIALSLVNCDNTNSSVVSVSITPSTTGVFKSNCQTATVNTNNPGYALTIKANTSTLNYQNPTTVVPAPTIPSTTNTIATPNTLQNDTWGFAAEDRLNFDDTYIKDNQNNNYSLLPTTDETVYQTTTFPLPETSHTFYYGTKLTTGTMSGTYSTTITYTAIGEVIPPAPKTCKNHEYAPECIEFTVDVGTTGTYSIPTSGFVTGDSNHTYNWDVYVDGYLTTDCINGNCSGISDLNSSGIVLAGLSNGEHQVLIVPHDSPVPGWGNAFGYVPTSSGANVASNLNKIISIDSPLTTMAFSPKTTESTTNASYMFAYLFVDCAELSNSVTIIDTYKLPSTITDLSFFSAYIHRGSNKITNPINLNNLSEWINQNESITNLRGFFSGAHTNNAGLSAAINFSALINWFRNNNSITNFSTFLEGTHTNNPSLTEPVNLEPYANWFNNNTSIVDFSAFLYRTHVENTNLHSAIDLSPVKNWFSNNESITNLYRFLYATHGGNNLYLTEPINLEPLENWFHNNMSINNLTSFFYQTHGENINMESAIDFSPLNSWFGSNRVINTISGGFMVVTHYGSPKIKLTGQRILPDWIKTMKNGSGTPVWQTGSSNSGDVSYVYAFRRMFYCISPKTDDTAEIRFQDGTTLSSLGIPNNGRQTYFNRSGITPENTGW